MKYLLLGAGSRIKKLQIDGNGARFVDFSPDDEIKTLDINKDHKPDVVFDLNDYPLPFEDNTFDFIQAVEVLEHIGRQGNYTWFFREFEEYWRILKPGGKLIGSVPAWNSVWAFGDPSHTRVLPLEVFTFLSQDAYKKGVGTTPMSDFRYTYKADFEPKLLAYIAENGYFEIEAIKPSRK